MTVVRFLSSRILEGVNRYHYELLKCFLCVLYHIADNAATNNMNAYNLAVCVAPSMLWAPKGSSIPATEQSNDVPPVIQFIIEQCVEIMGDDLVNVLGDRSEIVANHLTSDSEASTQDSRAGQCSTDDGIESPEPLSPKDERSSLHLSDSNLYVTSTLAVHSTNKSMSTPSSPCDSGIPSPSSSPPLKRHVEFSNQLSAAFCEPNISKRHASLSRRSSEPLGLTPDSMKLRLKGIRKSPQSRRQLSSTTTSAELIEHKHPPKTTASGRKLETAVLRRAHSPQTVRLFPATQNATHYQRLNPVPNYPASVSRATEVKQTVQTLDTSTGSIDNNSPSSVMSPTSPQCIHFPGSPRSPSPSPDQVFQAVDRRRQPAAPSYQEHMQRRREKNSKSSFFQSMEDKEAKDVDYNKEAPSAREIKEFWESKAGVQHDRIAGRSASLCRERLESSEKSDSSSTPITPLTPTSQKEYTWEHTNESSRSSLPSCAVRRLEHSPFGLNLHHKRNASEGSCRKSPVDNSRKTFSLSAIHTSSPLRATLNSVSSSNSNPNASLTHFPHSEFFPQEAQTKTHWGASAESRGTSAVVLNIPPIRPRRGSGTSSSSSVSSLDDRSSVGADSTFSEGKTDVTQIRDIKELLSENAQANGLKISPQTAEEIAKVKDMWVPHTRGRDYPASMHNDIENILFTEESYV